MRWFAITLALTGCGRIDFDPITRDDAAIASCQSFGPFGPPVRIAELATPMDDWGPWLSADKLDLYFSRPAAAPGNNDLYRAHRASTALPFDAAIALTGVNTAGPEEDPYVSSDGLTLYFDLGGDTIYRATRADTSSEFANPVIAADLNAGATTVQTAPSLTPDQRTVVFDSNRIGGDRDIFIAMRGSPADAFGPATQLTGPSQAGQFDASPCLDPTGTTLYFTSTRFDGVADRIYTATGSGTAFDAATLFDPISGASTTDDVDSYMTPDGLTMVFASNRPGGSGGFDLYLIERPCLDGL